MIDKNTFKISILIPCYNEKNTIILVVENVRKSLKKNKFDNYELIIVDDYSSDGTREILKQLENQQDVKIIYHDFNQGKGGAIQTAITSATGEVTLIQDADLEYDPNDYPNLLLPFFETDADVVYGSRFIGGGKYVRIHFFWHFLANKILTFICNIFTNLNLTDIETGYKVFKTNVLKDIKLIEKCSPCVNVFNRKSLYIITSSSHRPPNT